MQSTELSIRSFDSTNPLASINRKGSRDCYKKSQGIAVAATCPNMLSEYEHVFGDYEHGSGT